MTNSPEKARLSGHLSEVPTRTDSFRKASDVPCRGTFVHYPIKKTPLFPHLGDHRQQRGTSIIAPVNSMSVFFLAVSRDETTRDFCKNTKVQLLLLVAVVYVLFTWRRATVDRKSKTHSPKNRPDGRLMVSACTRARRIFRRCSEKGSALIEAAASLLSELQHSK